MKNKITKTLIILNLAIFCLLQTQNCFAFNLFGNSKNNRNYIYITGSSTISPLMATISEEFSRIKNINAKQNILFPTPVVKSSGTGDGFIEFCNGKSLKYPDFVNASRAIRASEIYHCKKNNVKNIVKIKIGYDGIIFGNYAKSKMLKITKEQLFLALAKKIYDKKSNKLINNPYKKWSDINKNLPNKLIKIYGPPKSSGTRDIFSELVMKDYCQKDLKLIQSYKNKNTLNSQCHLLRNDNVFIESGENDNLIISKLKEDKDSFGIFGYNFLEINKKYIQPSKIDSILPSKDNISSKRYPLSRPLFSYVKVDNIKKIPAIKDFVKEIINIETIGPKGYLSHSGLISLQKNEFIEMSQEINQIINNN